MLFRSLIILTCVFACNLNAAIDIIFDYSYDNANFFGNEQKYIMEQVAYAFESRMTNETFPSLLKTDYGLPSNWGITNEIFLHNFLTHNHREFFDVGSITSEGNVIGKANELIIFLGSGNYNSGLNALTGYSWHTFKGSDTTNDPQVVTNNELWEDSANGRNSDDHFDPFAGVSR